MQFRERGILLPFGVDDTEFGEANSTLFNEDGVWLQRDSADPLEGWLMSQMFPNATERSVTLSNDLYGNLYFVLCKVLGDFASRIRQHDILFEISALPAENLQVSLSLSSEYDRVDVSNIIDDCYLGVSKTLQLGRSLLSPRNPRSTLVSLFMNAVQIVASSHQREDLPNRIMRAAKLLDMDGRSITSFEFDANVLRMSAVANGVLLPFQKLFTEYMNQFPTEALHGMKMKDNTIVRGWPFALKKNSNQSIARVEFNNLLESQFTGWEHYVEWQFAT